MADHKCNAFLKLVILILKQLLPLFKVDSIVMPKSGMFCFRRTADAEPDYVDFKLIFTKKCTKVKDTLNYSQMTRFA